MVCYGKERVNAFKFSADKVAEIQEELKEHVNKDNVYPLIFFNPCISDNQLYIHDVATTHEGYMILDPYREAEEIKEGNWVIIMSDGEDYYKIRVFTDKEVTKRYELNEQ